MDDLVWRPWDGWIREFEARREVAVMRPAYLQGSLLDEGDEPCPVVDCRYAGPPQPLANHLHKRHGCVGLRDVDELNRRIREAKVRAESAAGSLAERIRDGIRERLAADDGAGRRREGGLSA